MRTLLNETRDIEEHIFKTAQTGDRLVFDARLILEPGLHEKLLLQQKTYSMVQQYGRKQLKAEIEAVHQKIWNDPAHRSFVARVMSLFTA